MTGFYFAKKTASLLSKAAKILYYYTIQSTVVKTHELGIILPSLSTIFFAISS